MTRVNGILLIYHHIIGRNASTIMEHVYAFARHSRFRVWAVNTELGYPKGLDGVEFSIIILHYSLFGMPINLSERFLQFIETSARSYKIAFLQDEHRYWAERSAFINRCSIDCIYTLLEPGYFEETYLKYTCASKVVYSIPGYVSREMLNMASRYAKPGHKRKIDVGYRGRRLPYYMGRGSQEKHLIGVEFKKRALGLGLRVDIETEEEKRIYGESWPRFLGDCRAVLGVEAGVSVFDIDNTVRRQYEKICKGHPDTSYPDCSFEEFHNAVLAPHEDRIYYRTISPRHFEAAAFRNCQILFEGKYSGILKPMVHYIPLRKDFSNFEDVISMYKDSGMRRELTQNAYRDLIASRYYLYEGFILGFDNELVAEGFSPDIQEYEAARVNNLLNQDKWQRYLRRISLVIIGVAVAKIGDRRFPGRDLLKLVVMNLFRRMGI